ncbi:MAG: hypothetical protein HY840_10590 [Bacteroidetes bacterium]|nr:hypothetical protein [Bacteroidota bacterium]
MKKQTIKCISKYTNLFVLLFVLAAFQNSKFVFIKSIPKTSVSFTTDNLGNAYIVAGNIVEKYSPEGNFLKSYSDNNLGKISLLDANNPMKLLLFYEPFQQMIILDNTLTPSTDPIQFQSMGYNQISLLCSSHNNGTWIYDKQNAELIRFDQSFQKINQRGNVSQQLLTEINPNFLIEKNNRVFLNDSTKGIFVFDIYGTYNKTIPLKGLYHFQIDNDLIIFFKDGKMNSYNMKTLEEGKISLPELQTLDARTEKEKLYLLKQKSLDIYNVQK